MHKTTLRPLVAAVLILGGSLLTTVSATADHQTDQAWVAAGPTLDGEATVFLSRSFGQKSGTFKAMPESMLDKADHISGTYLVGTFRKVFAAPTEGMHGTYDESITTELIDCANDYFGTVHEVRKLKGHIVFDKVTPDADIHMIQSHESGIDGALCRLHQGQTDVSFGPKPNPSYNPHPTEQDYRKLVDKYWHPAAASSASPRH